MIQCHDVAKNPFLEDLQQKIIKEIGTVGLFGRVAVFLMKVTHCLSNQVIKEKPAALAFPGTKTLKILVTEESAWGGKRDT